MRLVWFVYLARAVDCDGYYQVDQKCNATCEHPTGVVVKKFVIEEEPQVGGEECPPEFDYKPCNLNKHAMKACKSECIKRLHQEVPEDRVNS